LTGAKRVFLEGRGFLKVDDHIENQVLVPRSRMEFVDMCGGLAQGFGLPRSVGEIYGLLYLSPEPLSSPEIGEGLSISKGSVSTGTRQLLALGFIRKVWRRDERKDFFEAEVELWDLMHSAYERIVKVRAHDAKRRLGVVGKILDEEKSGYSPEEYAVIKERLDRLNKLRIRAKQFMPLIERLIK